MTNTKYISSAEFLARAEIVTPSPLSRGHSASDRYANENGGKLFVGPMENQYKVKYFFDKLNGCGVVVECEDNPTQKNYAPSIKLTFNKPECMLLAMSWIMPTRPDELHYVSNNTCILWWD